MYTRAISGTNIVQPLWFTEFLQQKAEHQSFVLEKARIHYRHWPNPEKPGLLLVHGHAAHSHWWDFIAPGLIDEFDIAAIDLSGSGDSDHREVYSATLFAREIVECIESAKLQKTIVIGHSFGGAMARVAGYLFPERLSGMILADSSIPNHRGGRTPPPMPRTRERFYTDIDQGIRRFRLRPAQPCKNDYILDHIARHSLKRTAQGYCFKLDPAVFAKMPINQEMPVAWDMIKSAKIPVGMIYGEKSRFFPADVVAKLSDIFDPALVRCVPDAHHHVFIDQPLEFLDALKGLLEVMDGRAH